MAGRIEAHYPMLNVEQVDSLWAWLEREGLSRRSIARRAGVSVRTVQLGLARAKARRANPPIGRKPRPPRLEPLFGCRPFTPQSDCPHRGPIRGGERVACMVCHKTGIEDHPALQRDPRTDPAREPRRAGRTVGRAQDRETRKQRRARLFARSEKSITCYVATCPGQSEEVSKID